MAQKAFNSFFFGGGAGCTGTQLVAMVIELLSLYCGAHLVESYCKQTFLIKIGRDISFHHLLTIFECDVITWLICIF